MRTVVTLSHGEFRARELLRVCSTHPSPQPVRSARLARLVPHAQRYGFDLIVYVGLQRYLQHRQRPEIVQDLSRQHGIEVSTGTVSALCDRFLQRFERLHLAQTAKLREALQQPGYSLHVDATNDNGKGGLFICMDGWRGWVLKAEKIRTESTEQLKPIVEETVERFGKPVAVVRDMSKAVAGAVTFLREQGIRDFICQYHFLTNVGKAILERGYARIRQLSRIFHLSQTLWTLLRCVSATTTNRASDPLEDLKALIYWILKGDGKRTHHFPFGLPHLELVQRLFEAPQRASSWLPDPQSKPVRQALRRLDELATTLQKDPEIAETVKELEHDWQLFQQLRAVLQLEDPTRPRSPLLPEVELLARSHIEADLQRFVEDLNRRQCCVSSDFDSVERIILEQIGRYRQHLFGHPVLKDDQGQILAVVDRTNNSLETVFAGDKQGLRRRTGRKNLGRDLEDQPSQAVLVRNLKEPAYVQILCGSLDNLPEALARLEQPASSYAELRPRTYRPLQRRVRQLLDQHPHTIPTAPLQFAAADPTES